MKTRLHSFMKSNPVYRHIGNFLVFKYIPSYTYAERVFFISEAMAVSVVSDCLC